MITIPIFFTFDNNYAVPAAVAFYSLLNRAKPDVFYEMHVLHSDITTENQNLLQSVIGRFQNAHLSFVDTKGFLTKEWENGNFDGHQKKNKFCTETILKCFGSKFFPQYDKIIYSDVDVVFMDDISELWDIDLMDKYLAGVKNPFMKYSENELSHLNQEYYEKLKDSYFAGGIWVLNLKQMRSDNLEAKMMEIINDEKIIKRWPDQDVINIACDNKVAYIPLNYIAYPYMLDLLKLPNFPSHYTRDELWDSIINPKIIHFAANKPWNSNPKYSNLWWTYFHYLGLEKTKIFKDCNDFNSQIENMKKKIKKYKKRCWLLEILSVILLIIVCGLMIKL